jgi:hypothetical protein
MNRENVMPLFNTTMGEREFYAALAMQAFIVQQVAPADFTAQQAVAYADALIQALNARAPLPPPTRS